MITECCPLFLFYSIFIPKSAFPSPPHWFLSTPMPSCGGCPWESKAAHKTDNDPMPGGAEANITSLSTSPWATEHLLQAAQFLAVTAFMGFGFILPGWNSLPCEGWALCLQAASFQHFHLGIVHRIKLAFGFLVRFLGCCTIRWSEGGGEHRKSIKDGRKRLWEVIK